MLPETSSSTVSADGREISILVVTIRLTALSVYHMDNVSAGFTESL